MIEIIKANRAYYVAFLVMFFIGLAIDLNIEKGDEIIFFAKNRNANLDFAFTFITKIGEAYIYVIAIALLLYSSVRYSLIVPLIGALTLLLSLGLKALFGTPRPRTFLYKLFESGELSIIPDQFLHIGYNSFPSGHSMSAFAIFTFVALSLRNKTVAFFLVFLAALVAFSRVVISQHFLEDILAGSFIGLVLATLVFYLQTRIPIKEMAWWDKPFTHKDLASRMRRRKQV